MTKRYPIAQGDLLFVPVDVIPASAKLAQAKDGYYIVGHSETGHHHVMEKARGELYEAADDQFCAYIKSLGAEIEHRRPHDTHAPVMLAEGNWQVRRQREYTPEGWRRVED